MKMMTMSEAVPSKMSDLNLARYLRDYGKSRAGEIRALTMAAADRILDLNKKIKELEGGA